MDELAFAGGEWHWSVKQHLTHLKANGICDVKELSEVALFQLQNMQRDEACNVLIAMREKDMESDQSEWMIAQCKERRQKFGTLKEKNDYKNAFANKAAAVITAASDKILNLTQTAACKGKSRAPNPLRTLDLAVQERAKEKSKKPYDPDFFHYVRVGDRAVKVYPPTTKETPVVPN